ncbi:MAG: hypothetical protein JJ971_15660 [Balneolaceae bacterium]|nr:hypothetical protein [Balneolaceae bacterium]MBO6547837.1 hypothetical protein [Balneolaceae bacterium]MBO6648348.1 hypothetical protein [Balneolaceae bacterium]
MSILKFGSMVILLISIFYPVQRINAQDNAADIIRQVKAKLGTPEASFSILSVAKCLSPERAYTSKVEGNGDSLSFKQVFPDTDEVIDLRIQGDKGIDGTNSEPLGDFMIFYGRMHDFVRIALQPEYFLVEIDSLQKNNEGITLFGKTVFGYVAEYKINSDSIPSEFTFYLDDGHFINTIFEFWNTTKEGIKVPKLVRIIDGEKIFTFDYKTVTIN